MSQTTKSLIFVTYDRISREAIKYLDWGHSYNRCLKADALRQAMEIANLIPKERSHDTVRLAA